MQVAVIGMGSSYYLMSMALFCIGMSAVGVVILDSHRDFYAQCFISILEVQGYFWLFNGGIKSGLLVAMHLQLHQVHEAMTFPMCKDHELSKLLKLQAATDALLGHPVSGMHGLTRSHRTGQFRESRQFRFSMHSQHHASKAPFSAGWSPEQLNNVTLQPHASYKDIKRTASVSRIGLSCLTLNPWQDHWLPFQNKHLIQPQATQTALPTLETTTKRMHTERLMVRSNSQQLGPGEKQHHAAPLLLTRHRCSLNSFSSHAAHSPSRPVSRASHSRHHSRGSSVGSLLFDLDVREPVLSPADST
jgi:hypothetical protein